MDDPQCAEDLALEAEYDERFDASDLLGASSVLHLQAMQEAALGNSTPARLLAGTAIYFAELSLSMNEDGGLKVPRIIAEGASKVNPNAHLEIREAAEAGIQAARQKLVSIKNTALEDVRDKPAWPPNRIALLSTYCYALQAYAQIAQDKFHGTDPTVQQRNRALWAATDIVDEILVKREKRDVKIGALLPREIKLQLATFAFDLISSYDPQEAERELVLEAQDACYQDLLETLSDATGQGSIHHRAAHDLALSVRAAHGEVAKEQRELGFRRHAAASEIVGSWGTD